MLSVKGPTETSRMLRISRFSLFEWARKQRAFEQGLCTDSPLADSARILAEWKNHPGLGPSQIRNQLRRRGPHPPRRVHRGPFRGNGTHCGTRSFVR